MFFNNNSKDIKYQEKIKINFNKYHSLLSVYAGQEHHTDSTPFSTNQNHQSQTEHTYIGVYFYFFLKKVKSKSNKNKPNKSKNSKYIKQIFNIQYASNQMKMNHDEIAPLQRLLRSSIARVNTVVSASRCVVLVDRRQNWGRASHAAPSKHAQVPRRVG